MKQVLVTGGAGFIGSNLVAALRAQGIAVAVLDNLSSGYASNLEAFPDVKFVSGDVRDAAALDEAMAGADVVFHLAASVGNTRSIEHPIEDADINVLGTIRVLEAIRRHRARKIVFSSSAGIFGELRTLPIREDHPVEPESPYGASKLAAEKVCLAYGRLYGFEVACLRYFNVYGPNQRYDAYGNVIPIFVHRLLAGQPLVVFGDGEQTRDLINVADVAQANVRAGATTGAVGAFNIASGTRISINRLAELICELSGRPARIEHGPPRAGDVRDSLADISAAQRAFNFQPSVTIETGLKAYLQWAEQAGV
jgi:UDP-glucose 4-epimerase